MGKTDDTSKGLPDRNPAVPFTDPKLDPSLALIEAIEVERARLMKAESVLHCVIVAMTDDDDFDDGETPYYPSVIEQARELVNQVLEQLDSVKLGPMIEKLRRHAETRESERGTGYEGVREPRVEYRVS